MPCVARPFGFGSLGLRLCSFVPTITQRVRASALLWFCAALCACMVVPFSVAQVSASLSGVITDPSGAAVVGAAVTAKSLDTGVSRTAATDQSGRYRFFLLPGGCFEV